MSQAFSFGFESDDIEKDAQSDGSLTPQDEDRQRMDVPFIPTQLHSLQDILSTFPSRLSFDIISLSANTGDILEIPRRDLVDIRAQLMAEDEELSRDSIAGLSDDDIVPNVYEGGFKTWECSVDLANYVSINIDTSNGYLLKSTRIIEDLKMNQLGAGTALPSISMFYQRLNQRRRHEGPAPKLQICLADYNRSVLELATIPNLYLALSLSDHPRSASDVECEPDDLKEFHAKLSSLNIDVSAISGSWTPQFADLIPPMACSSPDESYDTIILASETIYSPASISTFTGVVLSILAKAKEQGSRALALVAAKRVYFGVGGGIDEFLKVLEELGGRGTTVWETKGAGVGRVIIQVILT